MIDLPLAGIRVVDLVRGPLAVITRYLAELGASVDRLDDPVLEGDAIDDLAANAGKQRHRPGVDAAALIAAAHIVVADRGQTIDLVALSERQPAIVAMTVSDFGSNTSISGWKASGPVLHALSGELARSGIRGREPLLPPGDLAYQCAAAQAAFALVTALYRALRTGAGEHIDFSALDGAVQALDPGYGISGSATLGKSADLLSRDRPVRGFQYPILPCADGHVRICLLAKRQWRGMFRWMGEPAEFSSPDYDRMTFRHKSPTLLPEIARFFAGKTREEIEAGGTAFGVPVSALLKFEECVGSAHMRARGAIATTKTADGAMANLPNGMICIDGARAGPAVPHSDSDFSAPRAGESGARPFAGLRVLDLGVIVVGAEQGRLLGDQGADVVKVESRAYPDGNRQSYLSYGMSVSFAAGHRNKRGLGINLRAPEGHRLFLELAARADVILSNFKPGTMASLGLDYATIAARNPGIIMTDSSAFGPTGPWSSRMGYGPLVRAATGLTLAWRYPDDPGSFSDSVTTYPDHVAARVGAIGTVALLIRRLRTGRGGTASIAQSEVMLGQFAADVARVSLGGTIGEAPDWPWSVYPAAGQDEWCVVTVDGDASWRALCDTIGFPAGLTFSRKTRLERKVEIDVALIAWLSGRRPKEAADVLQAGGVAAAPMLRLADMPGFVYYRDRSFYRQEEHPYLDEPVVAERRHATGSAIADALVQVAPLVGEHSREVMAEWLGLDDAAIDDLLASGALEEVDQEEWDAIRSSRASLVAAVQ